MADFVGPHHWRRRRISCRGICIDVGKSNHCPLTCNRPKRLVYLAEYRHHCLFTQLAGDCSRANDYWAPSTAMAGSCPSQRYSSPSELGESRHDGDSRRCLDDLQSPYAPIAVGIGQIALPIAIVIIATAEWRQIVGKAWRWIHVGAFFVYFAGALHGIFSGSDTRISLVSLMYVVTISSVIFLTVYRVVFRRSISATIDAV